MEESVCMSVSGIPHVRSPGIIHDFQNTRIPVPITGHRCFLVNCHFASVVVQVQYHWTTLDSSQIGRCFTFAVSTKPTCELFIVILRCQKQTWQGKAACSPLHFIHAANWKKKEWNAKIEDRMPVETQAARTRIVVTAGCVQTVVPFRGVVVQWLRLWGFD